MQHQASHPPRIVVSSASVGAGHNQAGLAVVAGLKAARPDLDVEFIDALSLVPAWFRLCYVGAYEVGVTRFRRIYGWCYRRFNRPRTPRRGFQERQRLRLERIALRAYRRWLLDRRPALVVATHYLTTPLMGRLIGRGIDGLRQMIVITDNDAHRFWFAENVERYFVPNPDVREQLAPWGVDLQRVVVSGIPVHPKWTRPLDRQRILSDWRLTDDRPIVLLSGGTYFVVGPVGRIARGILDCTDARVVVLAGSNKKLLDSLARFPEAGDRLLPVPFTDKAHELAEVSAMMITKPGGLTTTECLAKGLPMVLTEPVPGQEAANAAMLSREGAAVLAPTTEEIISQVRRLLESPDALAALRANAKRLHKPATDTIVGEIIKALG